jgi:hypothetical protein
MKKMKRRWRRKKRKKWRRKKKRNKYLLKKYNNSCRSLYLRGAQAKSEVDFQQKVIISESSKVPLIWSQRVFSTHGSAVSRRSTGRHARGIFRLHCLGSGGAVWMLFRGDALGLSCALQTLANSFLWLFIIISFFTPSIL